MNSNMNFQQSGPHYPPRNNPNSTRYRNSDVIESGYRVAPVGVGSGAGAGAGPSNPEIEKGIPSRLSRVAHPTPLVRLILDIILFLLAWVPLILLNTIAKPFERGFYCDDESIRYPYKKDTITPLQLYSVGAAIVAVTILIMEAIIAFDKNTQFRRQHIYSVRNRIVHPFLSSIFIYMGYNMIGFIFVQITTDICKNMVGRLRPNFISACKPDWSRINCTQFSYIEDSFCQERFINPKVVAESRLSFLSGHASYSAYMMWFLVFYLQARWSWNNCSIVTKYFLQFAFLALALFTGLSRISDYKHHWSDVLCGFALGTAGACLTTLHIGKFFKREFKLKVELESERIYDRAKFGPMSDARYEANERTWKIDSCH